jgi:pyruvate dehydrogenase E2 component (dihydrolipoamide acetyltransferase)
LAEQHGLDLNSVKGTGPNDRIVRADVEEAVAAGANKPAKKASPQFTVSAAAAEFEDLPTTNIRRVIAERLSYSK